MKIKRKKFVITIDGPASSGKSTTAKMLAKKLNCIYIDSGSMYRAVALYLKDNSIDLENENALKEVLYEINIEILYKPEKNENAIFLNGKDVSTKIRNSEITNYSSIIAKKKIIRERMVELQRKMAETQSIIMDGRDIGTVVFPDADFKFFLKASIDERAKRRFLEMKDKSASSETESRFSRVWRMDNISLGKIKKDLKWRDRTDSNREISPLKMANDAIEIDTTNLTIEEQTQKILDILKYEITL
ncbi:MAG: (d)CMP kinase [Candidatus Cloacimonetes bacterium]|nr:(d)CMP kinase [Candidatus Cloacimonadota bacterium]